MSFLNNKERVIDLQLTSYGKRLLAEGKFNPVGYDFFDDDILYDGSSSGKVEEQNDIQPRILEETPRLAVQHVFSNRDEAIRKLAKEIRQFRFGENISEVPVVIQPEKSFFLSSPLGDSDSLSEYAPSWKVVVVGGRATGSVDYYVGDNISLVKIPQIDLADLEFKTIVRKGEAISGEEGVSVPRQGDMIISDDLKQIRLFDSEFSDGSYIETSGELFVVDLEEANVRLSNNNFDVEVFLVEEKENDREELIPLSFIRKKPNYINGILLDVEEETGTYKIDASFAEKYFEFRFDDRAQPLGAKKVPASRMPTIYTGVVGSCSGEDEVNTLLSDLTAEQRENKQLVRHLLKIRKLR